MLTINEIVSQIKGLADAHYQIREVGVGTIAELQAKEREYPLLWISHEAGSLDGAYKTNNIRLTVFDRVLMGQEGQDDSFHEQDVLSDTETILLDFLNYFHQQHSQRYARLQNAPLEHFTERTNDRTAGWSTVLELRQFYDWNKCSIPETGATIDPSVDGLTLYDFCDDHTIARLTSEQRICLEAELCGTPDPVQIQVNGVNTETAESGTTYDQAIHDSSGADVGTSANPSVVADATVENSDASYSGTVKAEGTLVLPDITFTDSDGTTSSVPSVQDIAATPCGATSGSISVALSDSSPSVGDTITITATATGYTPNSYLYFVYDGSGNIVFIAEQASNTFNWLVPANAVGFTEVYVLGVENGSPDDVTAFGVESITVLASLLLDLYPTGTSFGFSVRKLKESYAGALMKIRRSSDNAEKDFYPDMNNELSMSSEDGSSVSLSTWIGSDTGYVSVWYDQSGNGNDVVSTSASRQPIIVSAGTLNTVNGKAAIDFDGSSDILEKNPFTPLNGQTEFMLTTVFTPDNVSLNNKNIVELSNTSGANGVGIRQTPNKLSSFVLLSGGAVSLNSTSNIVNTTQYISSLNCDNTQNVNLRFNGAVEAFGSSSGAINQGNQLGIGAFIQGVNHWDGKIQEVVIWVNDYSASVSDIETNTNDFFTAY